MNLLINKTTMRISFSRDSHAVYILLKLTVCLRLLYTLFLFPLWAFAQARPVASGLKVWGALNIFRGWRLLVAFKHIRATRGRPHLSELHLFLYFLMKNFGTTNKIWRSRKNLRGIAPERSPWLEAWFQFSRYLAKPTWFDETM